mmetsp:Transcript_22340/g.55161  ORF Transcript_22340/g.55161 Transcript_22340/m.55161 type:complete len:357 (-) Transcript_22340:261-1331(-)|eukprot:CAMPEP_0181370912 /NCGR_PEP_ID=MMETSP1106-20121128/13725_1 /TAXON_ID=81844 /ORGANISM="Mantoniella antarctica, Strain SL-175" /LENGTH=356 /DNA_ID=CAMNT_0023487829 /DNA_START=96 /DNA_END=1166 /DNA_ORIENTATION=+
MAGRGPRPATTGSPAEEDDDDGFGGTLKRLARLPRPDDALYDEGGDLALAPWWTTPFLEPQVADTDARGGRPAPVRGGAAARDQYSPDLPLWDTVSHHALMSIAVRNLVKALEKHRSGEKVRDSCVRVMTVQELRVVAEAAMTRSLGEVEKLRVKRVGEPREITEHPEYVPVDHVSLEETGNSLTCDMRHVDLTGGDLLDLVRDRVQWLRNVKKRLKKLTQVIYWRTGKPLSIIREEVVQRELRECIRAKKSGEAPPATVFGTPQEAQALAPVVNDRRGTLAVELSEHLSGEVILLHPEEHENRFLELLSHELTRFDVHLMSIKYHVNLGIDYDSRGNMLSSPQSSRGCCSLFSFG